jgi:hypothetical protein
MEIKVNVISKLMLYLSSKQNHLRLKDYKILKKKIERATSFYKTVKIKTKRYMINSQVDRYIVIDIARIKK